MQAAHNWLKALEKGLRYLRIQDDQKRLSLTNLAMLVVLYKICITPVSNFEDITALAVAILGYQIKRFIEKK